MNSAHCIVFSYLSRKYSYSVHRETPASSECDQDLSAGGNVSLAVNLIGLNSIILSPHLMFRSINLKTFYTLKADWTPQVYKCSGLC